MVIIAKVRLFIGKQGQRQRQRERGIGDVVDYCVCVHVVTVSAGGP